MRICAVFHVLSSTGIRKRRNTKAKPLDSGQSLPPRSALIAGMTTNIKSVAGTGPRACPGVGVSTLASFARQLLCRGGSRTAPQGTVEKGPLKRWGCDGFVGRTYMSDIYAALVLCPRGGSHVCDPYTAIPRLPRSFHSSFRRKPESILTFLQAGRPRPCCCAASGCGIQRIRLSFLSSIPILPSRD